MWHVYIIECSDGCLYTGITNNIEKRIEKHNHGQGCKFTKYRIPVELKYKEFCGSKSMALKREAEIKSWKRERKLRLIAGKA